MHRRPWLLLSVLFCGIVFAASDGQELFRDDLDQLNGWKSNDTALQISTENTIVKDGAALKLHFKITDKDSGHAWPQAIRSIQPLQISDDSYVEFDCFYKPVQGEVKLRFVPKEQSEVEEILFPKLLANAWNHVVLPLKEKKNEAWIKGFAFVNAKRTQITGDEAEFLIDNIRIFKGQKHDNSIAPEMPEGTFSLIFKPANKMPKDTRLEIEIPNLLRNGYFREGGNRIPPRGWAGLGMENAEYTDGLHDGRALRLAPGAFRYVACRQNGLVLIPGEKYRMAGYIRGV
ncbi:MAG: hypothetical protein WCT05_15865, partial [Lentisphaeria bacterium]